MSPMPPYDIALLFRCIHFLLSYFHYNQQFNRELSFKLMQELENRITYLTSTK